MSKFNHEKWLQAVSLSKSNPYQNYGGENAFVERARMKAGLPWHYSWSNYPAEVVERGKQLAARWRKLVAK